MILYLTIGLLVSWITTEVAHSGGWRPKEQAVFPLVFVFGVVTWPLLLAMVIHYTIVYALEAR